jgi:hypothetical protein
VTIRSTTADAKRMGSSVRILLFALLLALATLAGTVGVPFTDASSAASVARDQTMFGMDVPSLAQLDASETKVGARHKGLRSARCSVIYTCAGSCWGGRSSGTRSV